jgi:hypothetical protein
MLRRQYGKSRIDGGWIEGAERDRIEGTVGGRIQGAGGGTV